MSTNIEEAKSTTDQLMQSEEPKITSLSRLLEVYDQIAESDDIGYKTASLLTISNFYSYALRISNIINGRQGRNRLTVSYDTYRLMNYSLESDVNDILDKQLTDLFVGILNTYLSDKQELPGTKPRIASGILNRVKALMIMLVSTNQYGIIPLLSIPPYMLKSVGELFDNIQSIKEDVLDSWIKWLIDNNNQEMAEIVKSVGNEFWGSEGIKANVIYDRYFGHMEDRINNTQATYQAYLQFRAEYRKSTKNILPSRIYEIFNITPDAYDKARRNVYLEIGQLFPEDENAKVIQRLIYEQ